MAGTRGARCGQVGRDGTDDLIAGAEIEDADALADAAAGEVDA